MDKVLVYTPTLTWGHVSVLDKQLPWLRVIVKQKYTKQQYKCKCKSQDVYKVYMLYICLLTLTCTTLANTIIGVDTCFAG